ncbi:SPFH domain-containing protein [Saccharopolyspora elongata]|uniref:SPFH domain-containing protein n=1 Tax=Saccharopolyspora elongata TaxID=2530387 RepID=UPI0014045DBD|nr:SPFH domain-containing protein [Saccharopolyspora elongata]
MLTTVVVLSVFLLIGLLAFVVKSIGRVPTGHVGLVYRTFGRRHPDDRFRVRVHGSPGPQAAILEADHIYFLPFLIYKVTYAPQTYVPPGTIGVVRAKEGATPQDRPLCRHVECDQFQDGHKFLTNGGQAGKQPAILRGGASYDINPWIFDVITVDNIGEGRYGLTAEDLREITVPEGETGVVIALDGNPPGEEGGVVGRRVPGHQSFEYPWKFLANGGQRGAQAETLSHGGLYAINPWFARIVLIPTRNLTLEWTRKEDKPRSNFDAALDKIVINVEGHRLSSRMSQIIRIPAKAAPQLVGLFGEHESDAFGVSGASDPTPVQRFVEGVLGRTVEGYFHSTAADYRVLDFLGNHNEVRLELEGRVRDDLAEWDVEAVRTTLGEFEPEGTDIDRFRQKIQQERDRQHYLEHREKNVQMEAKIEEVLIAIERNRGKVATAELEDEIRLLGVDHVAFARFLDRLAEMDVPEFVGSDSSAQNMPLPAALNLINKYLAGPGREPGATSPRELDPARGSRSDHQLSPQPADDDSATATTERVSRVRGTMRSTVDGEAYSADPENGQTPKINRVRGTGKSHQPENDDA